MDEVGGLYFPVRFLFLSLSPLGKCPHQFLTLLHRYKYGCHLERKAQTAIKTLPYVLIYPHYTKNVFLILAVCPPIVTQMAIKKLTENVATVKQNVTAMACVQPHLAVFSQFRWVAGVVKPWLSLPLLPSPERAQKVFKLSNKA